MPRQFSPFTNVPIVGLLFEQTASEEAAIVSFGPEPERIYCPNCRRQRAAVT